MHVLGSVLLFHVASPNLQYFPMRKKSTHICLSKWTSKQTLLRFVNIFLFSCMSLANKGTFHWILFPSSSSSASSFSYFSFLLLILRNVFSYYELYFFLLYLFLLLCLPLSLRPAAADVAVVLAWLWIAMMLEIMLAFWFSWCCLPSIRITSVGHDIPFIW